MDFLDFYYPGWIKTLDWVIEQDVDLIDVGHCNESATTQDTPRRERLPGDIQLTGQIATRSAEPIRI